MKPLIYYPRKLWSTIKKWIVWDHIYKHNKAKVKLEWLTFEEQKRDYLGRIAVDPETSWGTLVVERRIPKWIQWDNNNPEILWVNLDYVSQNFLSKLQLDNTKKPDYWHFLIVEVCRRYIESFYPVRATKQNMTRPRIKFYSHNPGTWEYYFCQAQNDSPNWVSTLMPKVR